MGCVLGYGIQDKDKNEALLNAAKAGIEHDDDNKVDPNELPKEDVTTTSPVHASADHKLARLKVLSWNIAGINNNPWEYYVALDDDRYNMLMSEIEGYLTKTGKSVKVQQVLDQIDDQFLEKISNLLGDRCSDFSAMMSSETVSQHLSGSLCAFLESKHFGNTRLISWPDRLLNTIDGEDEKEQSLYRPTAINYYPDRFQDASDWFQTWLSFMDTTGMGILEKNRSNKYAQKLVLCFFVGRHDGWRCHGHSGNVKSVFSEKLCVLVYDQIF